MPNFIPIAYVKTNCPFSFKFRLFVVEAGLADQIDFVELDVDAPSHAKDKMDLRDRVGRAHTFPIAEVTKGEFLEDSDALIRHFAEQNGINDAELGALNFYRNGLFPTFLEMFHVLAMPLGWIARLGRRIKAFR